jgi:hypothetical protein
MDVPLMFEMDGAELAHLSHYLDCNFHSLDSIGDDEFVEIFDAACGLAERGIPQGITHLVRHELLARGRLKDAESMAPFVVNYAK